MAPIEVPGPEQLLAEHLRLRRFRKRGKHPHNAKRESFRAIAQVRLVFLHSSLFICGKGIREVAFFLLQSSFLLKHLEELSFASIRLHPGHEIGLGNYDTFRGHLLEGGLGGTPRVVNPPGADPIHHEYQQGRTAKMAYNDAEQNWSWENSNYMLGKFTVDSAQYKKYAAGLAQKMAGPKEQRPDEKK